MARKRNASSTQAAPQQPQNGDVADFDSGEGLLYRHAFVQTMLQLSCVPEPEAQKRYRKITGQRDDSGYRELLNSAKLALDFLQLDLKRLKYPADKQYYVAIVNQTEDETAKKHGSHYSPAQTCYLRTIIETIAAEEVDADGMAYINGGDALYVTYSQATQTQGGGQIPALTMTEKEASLERFLEDKWLFENEQGFGIGVRSFMELHKMLLDLDLPDHTREVWERFI